MIAIEKMPSWIRAAEIILGLVSLLAGIYVLAYPLVAVFTLIVLLAVGLIFLGARDIVLGAMGKFLPSWLRAANIVLGVLAFVLSVVVINEPGFAVRTLVLLLYVVLFVRGVAGISLGAAGKQFSAMLRGLSVGVGVLSIILAIVFLAVPALGVDVLIILLSLGLLIAGLESIAAGVIGRKIVPVMADPVKV
ncbi:MAG TPA: DUF308 domain-containing protein [Candidatus Bathyarchaeia archaeon]|nr:DUF308 domain-containing protein [Candidatus Bathyarchaeia archaeon]